MKKFTLSSRLIIRKSSKIAAVFALLCFLFINRSAFSQTYSAYQAGNQTTYGTDQWIGYVYSNNSWTGYMGYYYAPANFSFNWGTGGPGPFGSTYMSDNDYYWIRHKMTKTFETGVYSIIVAADDGAKVSTNGGTSWNIIDNWDCSGVVPSTSINNIALSGSTNVIFEYAECEVDASASIYFCQKPGTVQNPAGVGTGLNSATISWSAGVPTGTNTYYNYSLYKASDNTSVSGYSGIFTQSLSANLTGLQANTGYYFKMYSQAGCWASNSTEVTSPVFYTGIIPGTPTSLTTTAIGTTTATLNWAAGSPVGNPAPTYYWVLKNAGGTTFTSGNTTGFTVSVGGLTTNTSYYFTVYASNNVGTSAIATSANMATLPVTPTSVTATPSTIAVGNSSNLNATSAGNTIDWYTASSGGTTLGSIASGSNFAVSPASSTTYYAEAVGQATNTSELDILPGGTSWGYQYGTMFNVTAISGNRAVTGFRDDIFQEVGNLKVYYKTGSYSGYETNSSAWTYLGQYTSSLFTDIPDITIPSGSTYAFYIYVEGSSILKSTSTGTTSDSRLSVTTGSLTSSLFGGVSSGSLYGTVYYGDRGAASTSRTSVVLSVVQAPTTQASGISFSSVSARQMTASWTKGNGTSRAVFIKAASSGNAAPVNGTAYTANTAFGSGTQIASTGWYCVYNGTGSSVTVTGLTPNTAYQVHVCEYSGTTGNQAYNVATATNNPKSQTSGIPTISSFTPTSASTGTSVVITGTDLTGATAVKFGGTPAISFTVNSATQITAIVGGGTTGSVSITTPEVTVSLAGFTFTLPAPPTGVTATPSTIAVGNSSNLNATSAGNTINWYTVSSGGTSLGSSASGANYSVTPATSTTYYAETLKPITGNTDLPLATTVNNAATGAMFNVSTLSLAKIITGFSFAPNISGVQQIKVYYKTGTYVGFQTNSAAWTYLGQFNSDGQAGTSLLDITDVSIPASTTYAFYLNSNSLGGLQFENGAATYADGSLSVACGSMLDNLFSGNYDNYAWRGTVKHAIPSQTSATRTSVGVTVTQAPATQASGVTFSSISSSQMTASWTNGSGTSRAVFIKTGSSGTAAPVNTTTYTANTVFGSGTQIGSTGWYCVYNGTSTSVTVTGLTTNTAYLVHVCEYNGTTGNQVYNTTLATNNPKSQITAGAPTISSFTPTSTGTGISVVITGTYLTGATAVSFGGTAAGSYTVNSATQITAVVSAGTSGSVSVTTPMGTATLTGFNYVTTPATQASNVSFASTTSSQTAVTWTNSIGSSRAVFILAGSTGSAAPVNGTTYTPVASWGFGTQIGSTSGWYCIYKGTGTSVTVNNLSAATTYRVMVTEYNGSAGGEMYNTSTATNNPNNVTTAGVPTISSFTPTSGGTGMSVVITGTYLTGATAVSFGGTAASSFSVNSATQITAVVAAGSTGSVSVTTPGGIATSAGFTYVATPSTQATNIVFSSVQLTQMTIGWTNGNGTNKAVFMKVASSGSASPVNGTAYTSNTTFGSGTQIGSSLWYCIYNGNSSSVTVTALAASTTYQVHVCEYNGNTGGQMYNTTSSTNNPISQATATSTISTSGTLTAFSSCAGTASAYQSFSASGSNLTANITVTAPTGFEVCLTSDGTYTSTVTLTQSGGSVASTPVYVRMTAAATGSPSGNVALSSSGATTVNVSASGTVSQSPTTAAAGDDQSNCNSGTFTLAGNNPSAGTGAWSIVSGSVTITTPSAYNSGVTGIPAGTSATLMWTISNSPCTASTDNVVLTNYELPVVASITGTNTLAVGTTSTLSCVTAGGSWSSSATAVATVNAGVVTGVTAGTATISYTVTDGNGCSNASTKLVTVGKGDQTISFTLVSPQNYGVSPITLNGTATSGLTVSYASSNTNVATISGNTLSIVGIGSATITASQAGNVNYNAADNVTQALTVNAAGLTWTGNTNTDWNTAGNWSPATVPTADYDVTIPSGTTYTPHITSAVTSPARCNSLTLASGSLLTIDAGKALTVNGTFTNSGTAAALVIESGGSLIETTSGVKATVERAMVAGEWHLISSPVSNATAGMYDGYYLQKHTESSNAYTDITTSGEVLTPMRGYALWGDAALPTATFSGLLNAEAKSFTTTAGTYTIGPPVNGGWNLVGNPYPSSIDWDAASGWTKTNVNSAIYLHVDKNNWATYNNGAFTNEGSQFIAPCQGFFVQATAAGELAMTDAVRVHNNTSFFKNSAIVPNLIRLEVSGNGYKDETVVRFVPEATAEFDGNYDAHKLFGEVAAAAQVYTTGTGQLSINSLPETNMVPVGVKIGSTGNYTIAATEINDMPYATLEDTKTGIFTELAKGPYTFNFTSGEDELRFKLHFSALSVNEDEASGISIYSYHKTAYINLKNQLKGDIYICNMAGQLITSRQTATGLVSLGINAPGIYIVKVVSDKETTTAKIFIQ